MAEVYVRGIEEIAQRIRRRVETLASEALQDLAQSVVEDTPVVTGFLRGSWYVTVNGPGTGPRGEPDPSGGRVVVDVVTTLADERNVRDTLWLLNNANYAAFVEFGTARMAGRGFVRKNAAAWPAIVENAARRIAR